MNTNMDDDMCPVEIAICEIESSSKPQADILHALNVLKRIVSNLISSPNEEKFKQISKKNELLAEKLFTLDGMVSFLHLLGFEERDNIFKFKGGDEKMQLLEVALASLTFHLKQGDQANPDSQKSGRKSLKKNVEEKKDSDSDRNRMLESVSGSKSESSSSKTAKPDNKVSDKEKEVFYNSKGYFIQVSGNDEKKKQKNENFDHHDMKKNNSIFSMLKLN